MEIDERTSSIGSAGVMAMACRQRRPDATREAPAVIAGVDQPATRERWAGPYGVTERSVVPRKPGNSGRGKGPQLTTDARSDEGHGDLTMSLATPGLRSGVADGVTCSLCVWGVSLFREPDPGNLPVRFDEREQETEPSQTGLRRRRESLVNSHRQTKATAPVLDSTLFHSLTFAGASAISATATMTCAGTACRHSAMRANMPHSVFSYC